MILSDLQSKNWNTMDMCSEILSETSMDCLRIRSILSEKFHSDKRMMNTQSSLSYTRLNIAAAMQIAATISDTIIRKMEKLYNFSGFCMS